MWHVKDLETGKVYSFSLETDAELFVADNIDKDLSSIWQDTDTTQTGGRKDKITRALEKQASKGSIYAANVSYTAIEMPEHMKQDAKVVHVNFKRA